MATISPYTGDGVTRQFDLTFAYRDAESVGVRVAGIDVAFSFLTSTRVQTEVAPPVGALVEVYRETGVGAPSAVFRDGQILKGDDLNGAVGQVLNRAEELGSELRALRTNSVRVTPGEAPMVLPMASRRAGKWLMFDAAGAPYAGSGGGVDTLREDLASGDLGTGLIRHKHRTLDDKLADVVSLDDFNFAGDDAAKMEAAFEYLKGRGGGTLNLPPRPIRLDRKVVLDAGGIHIRGSGHGCTWIVNGQTDAPALQIGKPGGPSELFYRNAISDVVFGQATGTTPVFGNCGLLAINQSNLVMTNIQVFQFPAKLYDGVVLDRVSGSQLNVFGIQECLNRGLAITNQSLDIYVSNGRSDGSKIGIEFRDVQGMYFSCVAAYGNTLHGLSFVTDFPQSPSQANRYFQFFNVVGDTSGSHNWNIRQLSLANFVACWASTQLKQDAYTEADGFFLSGDNVEDITFIAPMAASNNRHGIHLDYCRSVVIDSARLGSGAFPEDWGGQGANNGKSGYGSGLFVGAGSNYTNVSGGHYQSNTDFGIDVAYGAQRGRFFGVDLEYNQKGGRRNNSAAGQMHFSNCSGHNPAGYLTAPSMIPSDGEIINPYDVDATFYIAGGAVSSIRVNGAGVYSGPAISLSPPMPIFLPVGAKLALTYSSPPSWLVMGH